MRFELLQLAESASAADRGMVNALGLGARVVTLDRVPELVPLAIVGMVEFDPDEVGVHRLTLSLELPDGSLEPFLEQEVEARLDVEDDRVPTGLSFVVRMVRRFTVEGLYAIRAELGEATAQFRFVVRGPLPAQQPGRSAEPAARVGARRKRGGGNAMSSGSNLRMEWCCGA